MLDIKRLHSEWWVQTMSVWRKEEDMAFFRFLLVALVTLFCASQVTAQEATQGGFQLIAQVV